MWVVLLKFEIKLPEPKANAAAAFKNSMFPSTPRYSLSYPAALIVIEDLLVRVQMRGIV